MALNDEGWSQWCRMVAADFQRAAKRTSGTRSNELSELAAHYEGQATGADMAFAGNKPAISRLLRPTQSKKGTEAKSG